MSDSEQKRVDLRPVWNALLDVYQVFSEICGRHKLRYCADTGTTLGAIRHQGFIPWDDDVDIQMPRPDYEKFIEIAKRELPKGYAWLDRDTCPCYDNGFGKIIVTDESVVNQVAFASGLPLAQGIFIDIFPLDGYPDAWLARKWRRVQNYLVDFRIKYNQGWRENVTKKGKIAYLIGLLLLPFNYHIHNRREQVEFYEKRAKKYKFGNTKMCVSIGVCCYNDDKPYPLSYFGAGRKVPFEHITMSIQEEAEAYLTLMFGDYMQLPPKEKRRPGHAMADCEPWRLGWESHTTD